RSNGVCRQKRYLMKILPTLVFLVTLTVLQRPPVFAAAAKPTLPSFFAASTVFSQSAEAVGLAAAANKEGKVVVSVPASADLRKGIEKNFKQRFGIDAELNVGRSTSIVGKIQ